MKKAMIIVLLGGLVGVLAGCQKSAQEQLAEQQLVFQKAALADLAKQQAEWKAEQTPEGIAKAKKAEEANAAAEKKAFDEMLKASLGTTKRAP